MTISLTCVQILLELLQGKSVGVGILNLDNL